MKKILIAVCVLVLALIGTAGVSSVANAQSDLGREFLDPGSNPTQPPPPSSGGCGFGFLVFVTIPGGC